MPETQGAEGLKNLLCNLLVDLEVKGELAVVLLNNHAGGLAQFTGFISLCSQAKGGHCGG